MQEKLIGKITHYYNKLGVGIIDLIDQVKINDKIHFKGNITDFEQIVDSMQVEHQEVAVAKSGEVIGLKTIKPVKEQDEVFLVVE
jgi:U32 family peptidase